MVEDDFGEKCCKNEIMLVKKYVLLPCTSGHMVGHSFLQIPGQNCVGKYPSSTNIGMGILESIWNALLALISPAQIQDDSNLFSECSPERIPVENVFRACPRSLEKLRALTTSYSGVYILSNSQCDNWSDDILRKAGATVQQRSSAILAPPGVGFAPPVSREFDSPAERKINLDINLIKIVFPF